MQSGITGLLEYQSIEEETVMTDCPWWFEHDCEGRDCCECEFYEKEE